MRTEPRILCGGCFVLLDRPAPYCHSIGGRHAVEGASCPNCDKPLLLYATLDTSDPLLSLTECGVEALPLLYCMRCALCWFDFSYRVIACDHVELLEVQDGDRTWEDWEEAVGGDEFPSRRFRLSPIPEQLQFLWNKLNRGENLSSAEEAEVASLIGSFADAEVGGYPIVDTINQVGGRAFLQQRLDDPTCPYCERFTDSQDMICAFWRACRMMNGSACESPTMTFRSCFSCARRA